ncbi:MAG: hypothetical protein BWY15_01059 [Firmicutes bacterium ADurb.Bin193]|nr:MAG: hypothetical protein BWY15_01059 [Firmicutes bacterium ADurb.Bin193]
MEDVSQSPRIKRFKAVYSFSVCCVGAVFVSFCIAFATYDVLRVALISYSIACLALYLAFNMLVQNIVMTEKQENFQKEINMTYLPVTSSKGVISAWWYALYAPTIAGAWYLSWNSEIGYVYVLPSVMIVFFAVMLFIHFFIKNSRQYACSKNMERSLEENRRVRRRWSVFVFFAGLVTLLMLGVLQLGLVEIIKNSLIVTSAPFVVTVGITAATVFVAWNNK